MNTAVPEIPEYAYPPDVRSDEERHRWALSRAIAEAVSTENEPDGTPNSEFVMYFARTVYESDFPTGDPSDPSPVPELTEAEPELELDPVEEMWQELERTKPADTVTDPDVHWAHVGKVTDLLEELFGNPDDIDLGDHKVTVPPPGRGISSVEESELELEELFEHVVGKPYNRALHPKDRLGKWTHKLNGVRSYAREHRAELRGHVAASVAAASLHRGVERAHEEGGALHGDVRHAHKDEASRMRAHAAEARNRAGVSGARQQVGHHARRVQGHALAALAYMYSEEAAHKAGKLGIHHEEVTRDAAAAADTLERAKTTKEAAHEVARYAVEHRDELGHVIRAIGHLARHVAQLKGLSAAADTDEYADVVLDEVAEETAVARRPTKRRVTFERDADGNLAAAELEEILSDPPD